MSFEVDAFMGQPAPQPARTPRADAWLEAGPSFDDHLEDVSAAAPDGKPRAEERAEETNKQEAVETLAAPQVTPADAPAPVVLQLIASVEPLPVALAPPYDLAPESDAPVDAAPPDQAPLTPAAAPSPQHEASMQRPAHLAKSAEAPLNNEGGAKPQTDAPKTNGAEPTPELNVEAPIPALAPQALLNGEQALMVTPAAAPVVTAPAPMSERRQTTQSSSINTDAPSDAGDVQWAPNEGKPTANADKATAPTPNITKADTPLPSAAKDSFAAMLAARQQVDAPAPGNASSASLTNAALATSSAQASQAAPEAGSVLRAAPVAAQVGREIVRRFNGGSTFFELRLDPPEMGKIEVRLEVSRDHRVTAMVTADNPHALAELARNARDLQQALHSAGLELSEQGLSFDLSQQRESRSEADQSGARGRAALAETETPTKAAPLARPIGLESWRGVRVDVMA